MFDNLSSAFDDVSPFTFSNNSVFDPVSSFTVSNNSVFEDASLVFDNLSSALDDWSALMSSAGPSILPSNSRHSNSIAPPCAVAMTGCGVTLIHCLIPCGFGGTVAGSAVSAPTRPASYKQDLLTILVVRPTSQLSTPLVVIE